MKKLAISMLLFAVPAMAQHYTVAAPPVAASTPIFEVSAGYTYLALDTPSRQRVGLSGVDASGLVDFNPRWGMMLDSTYARAGNVLNTGHSAGVLSLLAGPVFYPLEYGNTRIFLHPLAGVSVVNSAVPVEGNYFLKGSIMRFSYAIGGGVERTIVPSLALRLGAEYLRTTFANPSAIMQFQNDVRLVTGIVYRFGNRDAPQSIR